MPQPPRYTWATWLTPPPACLFGQAPVPCQSLVTLFFPHPSQGPTLNARPSHRPTPAIRQMQMSSPCPEHGSLHRRPPYTLFSPASGVGPSSWGLTEEDRGDGYLWKTEKERPDWAEGGTICSLWAAVALWPSVAVQSWPRWPGLFSPTTLSHCMGLSAGRWRARHLLQLGQTKRGDIWRTLASSTA